MNYYQVIDDPSLSRRWFLKSPTDATGQPVNPESFRVARHFNAPTPLTISVRRDGEPVDWTFADFDMPVVGENVGTVLKEIAGETITLFPARVVGFNGAFCVFNALVCRKCIDEARSEFIKWLPEDGRADKVGQYRQVTKLRIQREAVQGLDIFRIDGWRIALIVSDLVKASIKELGASGISFLSVTDSTT